MVSSFIYSSIVLLGFLSSESLENSQLELLNETNQGSGSCPNGIAISCGSGLGALRSSEATSCRASIPYEACAVCGISDGTILSPDSLSSCLATINSPDRTVDRCLSDHPVDPNRPDGEEQRDRQVAACIGLACLGAHELFHGQDMFDGVFGNIQNCELEKRGYDEQTGCLNRAKQYLKDRGLNSVVEVLAPAIAGSGAGSSFNQCLCAGNTPGFCLNECKKQMKDYGESGGQICDAYHSIYQTDRSIPPDSIIPMNGIQSSERD